MDIKTISIATSQLCKRRSDLNNTIDALQQYLACYGHQMYEALEEKHTIEIALKDLQHDDEEEDDYAA